MRAAGRQPLLWAAVGWTDQCLNRQGKPLPQALDEIARSVGTLRDFAALDLSPAVLKEDAARKVVRQRKPLSVVAAITPWSFPMLLLKIKVAPALRAGNTVVAKPAPTTPLTTLRFGELCARILTPGVVNVLVVQNDLGPALTGHPDVAKVACTGSTATGKKVMASAAGTLKRLTLELGGNDAAIVLDDVDPKEVAPKIFAGATLNSGQVCVAIQRLYVHDSVDDAFCGQRPSAFLDATPGGRAACSATHSGGDSAHSSLGQVDSVQNPRPWKVFEAPGGDVAEQFAQTQAVVAELVGVSPLIGWVRRLLDPALRAQGAQPRRQDVGGYSLR
ncbi:MAG: aldehyde dehydrogenase family protein [Planctomycetaceae bacterium]|nr:aldehyde dehydrogenase family protein [Planctomycetaceae bacterium]